MSHPLWGDVPKPLALLGIAAVPLAMAFAGFQVDMDTFIWVMQWMCTTFISMAAVPVVIYLGKRGYEKLPRRCKPWPPPFELKDGGPGRGIYVVSHRGFSAGQEIFREPPLLQWKQKEEDFKEAAEAFLKAGESVQRRVLALHCPPNAFAEDDKAPENLPGPLATAETWKQVYEYLMVAGMPSNRDALWTFLCIADQNTTTGTEESAIYEWFSRMNHSCEPSCCAIIDEHGDMIWIAARDLQAGEELSTEYLDASLALPMMDTLLLPTAMRQERLQRWGFLCGCARCALCTSAANFEPERAFACSACEDSKRGRHFPRRTPPEGDEGGSNARTGEWHLTDCDACGAKPPENASARLQMETQLVTEATTNLVDMLEDLAGRGSDGFTQAVMSIGTRAVGPMAGLHDDHWLVRWLAVLGGGLEPHELPANAPEKLFMYFRTNLECVELSGRSKK